MKGENKIQFEIWYIDYLNDNPTITEQAPKQEDLNNFYRLPFEMQIGVYLAYYNSLGYDIYPDACSCHVPSIYTFMIKHNKSEFVYYSIDDSEEFKTPIEAYKEAFKQADEIVNKQLNKHESN